MALAFGLPHRDHHDDNSGNRRMQRHEDSWNHHPTRTPYTDDDYRRTINDAGPSRSEEPRHHRERHQPELYRRTAAPQDSSYASSSHSEDNYPPRYSHNRDLDNRKDMCNPHQPSRMWSDGRERFTVQNQGRNSPRRRSPSPPARRYVSSSAVDGGYLETQRHRRDERSYEWGGEGEERYTSVRRHQEGSRNYSYHDRHIDDRNSSYRRGDGEEQGWRRSRNIPRQESERHGRALGCDYTVKGRGNDRPWSNGDNRGTSDDLRYDPKDRLNGSRVSTNFISKPARGYELTEFPPRSSREGDDNHRLHQSIETLRGEREREVPRGYPLDEEEPYHRAWDAEKHHRRHEDTHRRLALEPPRNEDIYYRQNLEPPRNARNAEVSDGYRPGARDVVPLLEQRLCNAGEFVESHVSTLKKHGLDFRESSPPRKRQSLLEHKDTLAIATETDKVGKQDRMSTCTKSSSPADVVRAPPKSDSLVMAAVAMTPTDENWRPKTTVTCSKAETNTSAPNPAKGNDDVSRTTNHGPGKRTTATLASSVKEKTISGIPMRWLKPVIKPTPKSKIVKEALKPLKAAQPKSATLSTKVIPHQVKKEACSAPTSPTLNPVTDSEGGSTTSTCRDLMAMADQSKVTPRVPVAIVTTKAADVENDSRNATKPALSKCHDDGSKDDQEGTSEDSSSEDDCDSSDTDDDEVRNWASVMFGISCAETSREEEMKNVVDLPSKKPTLKLRLKLSAEKIALLKVQRKAFMRAKKDTALEQDTEGDCALSRIKLKARGRTKKNRKSYLEILPGATAEDREVDEEQRRIELEEEKRIREEAKPLTAAQIREILGDDDMQGSATSNWVRRSVRQPSRALLNSKPLKALMAGLKNNHPDMVVLKMKKYINDPDAPACVIDAFLEALEENSNCEALYIQNFNEGMRDRQVLHLLRILQSPKCRIWCMNIGENYNVEMETWDKFTKGLRKTKITHMYASEHTITTEMKDEIRETIRENRKKHDLHINPNNLDVIVQCTHCWWNPINAKVLEPYLRKRGYEHILNDKEGQGLRGSMSAAPSL